MSAKQTDLQFFDKLITTHALPTYSQMKYGRIAYLFAHIHALQELNIITENYIHYNFSAFCRPSNSSPTITTSHAQKHTSDTNSQPPNKSN